ncbi:hypothetical protein TREES_T100006213 [Tupaia chinensis]|uniref:Uncharacterized protein n=1 Tax=Tupaia chinensis TaxID=246437 RepID=L9L983_TUPCH|nr:hypothetical protein TREES_T100006213 [Tupaia chinensis]
MAGTLLPLLYPALAGRKLGTVKEPSLHEAQCEQAHVGHWLQNVCFADSCPRCCCCCSRVTHLWNVRERMKPLSPGPL